MSRLRILSNEDYAKLYELPKLTEEEKSHLFVLDDYDIEYLSKIDDLVIKTNYVLQLGYFKVGQYFYSFKQTEVKEDMQFIAMCCFSEKIKTFQEISKRQHYNNKHIILKKYQMADYVAELDPELAKYFNGLTKQHCVPRYLFDCVIDYLHSRKILRPSYYKLQDLVSSAINREKNRISNKIYLILDNSLRQVLDKLLEKENLFYNLSIVKSDQRDFATNEIRRTVEKNQLLRELYHKSVEVIEKLGISQQNVEYYNLLVNQYSVHKLKNLSDVNLKRLYLLCYVNNRFLKINDHLIASFIYKVNKYIKDADEYQKEEIYKEKLIDKENRKLAVKALLLYINKKVQDSELRTNAFKVVEEKKFKKFMNEIANPHLTPDFYKWKYYSKQSSAIKLNIRLIFKVIEFDSTSTDMNDAIKFFKKYITSNKSFSDYKFKEIPITFIPSAIKKYILLKTKSGKKRILSVDADNYEFVLYLEIEKGLDKGAVTVKDSFNYKSLDDELIELNLWNKEKDNLITGVSEQLLTTDFDKLMAVSEDLLDGRYKEVNKRISEGANDKIKIKYNKKGEVLSWRLPYKKADDSSNNPFYDKMSLFELEEVMRYTNHHTNFMKHFTHVLPSYIKTTAKYSAISACLVAKGAGSDIHIMKDISDIDEQELISTYNNYTRYETLTKASDEIINEVAKLPIFIKYNLSDYGIHASVDGQKLETKYNTIKARHSKKYYGLGKGIE